MANLKDIASLLKVDMPTQNTRDNSTNNVPAGQKRRAWLVDLVDNKNTESTESKEVYKPLNEKGAINQVDQEDSSIPFIDQVDQPLNKKGSIKGIYKPLSLKFADLRSNPLKLILFMYEISKEEKDKITRRVALTEIQQILSFSRDSARTALRFLLKNKLIERVNFKIGKTGWSQYTIKESLFKEIEAAIEKGSITPISISHKTVNQKGSNSSNNLINNTTTDIDPLSWENVDISPLEEIGLTKKHLLQLKKTTPEIVQESINHFAFGLKFNKKTQGYPDPISVLMSVLKRGEAWIEQNYKSLQEIALEKMLEQKKAEMERVRKLNEELLKMEFDEWLVKLSNEHRDGILEKILNERDKNIINSNSLSKTMREQAVRKHLLEYYKQEIREKKVELA